MVKTKTFELATFKTLDDEPGTFEALVSSFGNVDRDGDVVAKGAFGDSLATKGSFPIIWAHQWLTPPIGKSLSMRETEDGLLVKGRLFVEDMQLAREIFVGMKEGALREWSFGASIVSKSHEDRDGQSVTILEKLDLIEFGPCLKGANDSTYTLNVKAAEQEAFKSLQGDQPETSTDELENAVEPNSKSLTPQEKSRLATVLLNIRP